MENKKIKIIWLCHFANEEMKQHFGKLFINNFAPWIDVLKDEAKKLKTIELHIVSPNVFTNKDVFLVKEDVSYHFYQHIPIPFIFNEFVRKAYNKTRYAYVTNFFWIKRKVFSIINSIKPDLIHLWGAENPYYSTGILPLINKFPILLSIQGFIKNCSFRNYNIVKRIEIENEIIKKVAHVGVCNENTANTVLDINPNAEIFYHLFPYTIPSIKRNSTSDFDIVFFARLSKEKGIEDLLYAIKIIKITYSAVSVKVIGGASSSYMIFLKNLCRELKIEENVEFLGFLPNQENIYKIAIQAQICVLPTHYDNLPGTIVESMFMKLPVIAYEVGGIPEINRTEENIVLVEKLNINELASKILFLLKENEYKNTLAENAYAYAEKHFNNVVLMEKLVDQYTKILNNES